MNIFDTSIIHTKTIPLKEAIVMIVILLFLFTMLLIPIYQASTMRALSIRLSQSEREMILLSEQERLLEAYITKSSIPDVASQVAANQNMTLEKTPFHKAKLVVIREGE